jgi:hypothetical protein
MVWIKTPDRLGKSIRKQFIAQRRHRKQKHSKQEQQHFGEPSPGLHRDILRKSGRRKNRILGKVSSHQQIISRKDNPFYQE